MFIVDWDCPVTREFMRTKINETQLAFPFRWLIISDQPSMLNYNDSNLFEINALTDSQIILANWSLKNKRFLLNQFYKIEKNSVTIHEQLGYWNNITGIIDLRETRIVSRRRSNLHLKKMTASVVILFNDTHDHLTDYRETHRDSVTKASYGLVNSVMDILNVTRIFKFTNTWGYRDEKTNKITGMVGDLLYKEADIGGTSLFMVPDRVEMIEYLSMLTPTLARFIFRAPPLSNVANIYYLPFDSLVWLCAGLLVAFSGFIIYHAIKRPLTILQKYDNDTLENDDDYRDGDKNDVKKKIIKPVRPTDVILLSVGAICQMGTQIETKFLSAKISTLFFFVFLLFMYTSYTANIVSLLQATTKSIRTLEDLYHSKLEFGVDDTPYNRWYFPNSKETIRRAIYEKKIAPPKQPSKFVNASYGIARMREGMYAFHSERGPAYKRVEETFYEHEKCGLIELDFLNVIEPWAAIQKHSPYKEMIKVNFFKIREHGIQDREVSRGYTKRPMCLTGRQSFQSVRLIDLYILIQVLGTGFVCSIFVLIIENIIYRKTKSILIKSVCLS